MGAVVTVLSRWSHAAAKKMEVKVETPKGNPQQQKQNPNRNKNQKQKGKMQDKKPNDALKQISQHSKNILKKKGQKNRFQRFQEKLEEKPRPAGACQRALKAEEELGHSGRVYSVKIQDPPITQDVVKGWSGAIESAVFSRPVEPRQFLIVFKHDADVKKELDTLKKVNFAGGKILVEEKLESDTKLFNNPDQLDPFCLYVTNIASDANADTIKKLFPKAVTVSNPRRHNPKFGSSTKFCFVAFDNADDALAAFKKNYNATLSGNSIVMRFRRMTLKKAPKVKDPAPVPVKKEQKPAQVKSPKKEPEIKAEEPETDDDDDDEEDVDEEEGDSDEAEGVEMKMEGSEDDDDDDDEEDDDDLDDDDEEDDDDDDDDEEDEH